MSFKNEKTPILQIVEFEYICDIFFWKFESL